MIDRYERLQKSALSQNNLRFGLSNLQILKRKLTQNSRYVSIHDTKKGMGH
jgi:hypothetical protein